MFFDADLVGLLLEVFPESFNTTRTITTTEIYNGPYGTEEVNPREQLSILADNILTTAMAIRSNYGDRAISYIKMFSNPKEQRKDILAFNAAAKKGSR